MDEERTFLRHYLAAIAYRAQKALRGAPPEFASFKAGLQVRTPHELVSHMDSVLGYARTFFIDGEYRPPVFAEFRDAIAHFHEVLADLARHLESGAAWHGITAEALLHGPFSDVMTHVGQLAMLRRLAGHPVAPENFIFAQITPDNLTPDQALPARPDKDWPERP
jgi:hypothetical protein